MGKTGKEKGDAGAERKQRLAAELRANLKRRKVRLRDARDARDGQAGRTSAEQVKEKPD